MDRGFILILVGILFVMSAAAGVIVGLHDTNHTVVEVFYGR